MTRRGNGEGAVYFNQKRNRWEGQLDLGRDESGRRVRRKVTGKTRSAVAERLREIRARELHVRPSAEIQTVSNLLRLWLETAAAARLGEGSTLGGYRHHVGLIEASIGRLRLDRIGPEDIDRYLMHQATLGYSRATLVRHRSILGQAVRWGVRRRYIAWDVVAVAEMPPAAVFESAAPRTKNRRTPRALTADETRRLVDKARSRRNGAGVILGVTVGMRPGEWSALLWVDLDLERGVVHVRRAWKGSGVHRSLGEPKTKGSVRSVGLPGAVVADLRRHRTSQLAERVAAKDWNADDPGFVFTTRTGQPIDAANLRRLVREIAAKAGVGHVTPYDLRHTATSVLSEAGVRNEHLADLLGHVDTRMVERHYRHRLGDSIDVATGPMQAVLGG